MTQLRWYWRLMIMTLALSLAAIAHAEEDLKIRGQWKQGGLLFGEVPRGSIVKVNERIVRVSPEGHFVFGVGRDAPAQASVSVTMPTGKTLEQNFSVAKREYNIQRVDGVEQKHVTPPTEVLDRIAEEAALMQQVRTVDDPRTDFLQPFKWPLAGRITGVYGSQRVYNGVPRSPHYGLDIAGPVGAEVVAPAAGLVTLVEPDLYYSGGTLVLDHGHGLSSTFIHLSKILVKVGERITQGQPIALVGATGRATGPHLDWRMNWFDQRLDPQLLMDGIPMPGTSKPEPAKAAEAKPAAAAP